MNNETENDLPRNWPVWVKKIVRDLEASEKITGDFFLEKTPAWVPRIWFELTKLMFPTMKTDDYKESGVRFAGAILGHSRSVLNDFEKNLEKLAQTLAWLDKELRRKLNAKAYKRLEAEGEKFKPVMERLFGQIEKTLIRKDKAIKSALRIASEQTFEEQVDFFDAYSRALKAKIYDEQGRPRYEKLSSTTTIYVLMVVYWKVIAKDIRAVPVLHEWLCRIVGRTQVGDLDRTKGICRRFGIVLTHRGRPRKKR